MDNFTAIPLPEVLNLDQVAAALRVDERTITTLLNNPGNQLRGFKAGQQWRVHRKVLLEFAGSDPRNLQDFKVLTVEEVATQLQVHPESVYRWLNNKSTTLRGFKVGQQWRILEHVFNAYMGLPQNTAGDGAHNTAHDEDQHQMPGIGMAISEAPIGAAPRGAESLTSLEVHV